MDNSADQIAYGFRCNLGGENKVNVGAMENAPHRIEVPCREWEGRPLIRVSVQAYKDETDLERLLEALPQALP